ELNALVRSRIEWTIGSSLGVEREPDIGAPISQPRRDQPHGISSSASAGGNRLELGRFGGTTARFVVGSEPLSVHEAAVNLEILVFEVVDERDVGGVHGWRAGGTVSLHRNVARDRSDGRRCTYLRAGHADLVVQPGARPRSRARTTAVAFRQG